MGIPSYYKRLIDRFPALVARGAGITNRRCDVLLMDFNCLIYQCVRAETIPPFTKEGQESWETALLEEVKRYVVKVWSVAGRPAEVALCVDGVVPMAKIRQQRMRRFKSLWMAEKEREAGVRTGESWDTNAITPGTEFMEKLGRALRGLCEARGAGWSVSGADEPGEGEQKLVSWVRARAGSGLLDGKEVVVYGLDADLIVLSLLALARDTPGVGGWRLLRELAEFERGAAGGFGTLDVRKLLDLLVPPGMPAAEYMLEYACAMCFLGNDFLPHSLSVKMREGGHDLMCHGLVHLHEKGERLMGVNGRVNPGACASFLRGWAEAEEVGMCEAFEAKYKARGPPPRTDAERMMRTVQNLPLEWREEQCIWRGAGAGLVEGWQEIYRRRWMREADTAEACTEYLSGLQWIMDYYLGRPVSYTWCFPWNVPPLWSDLVQAFSAAASSGGALEAPPLSSPVAPQEQLAMVLPMGSWNLVRDPRLRVLPTRAPAYWPERFGFFSAGKRWMWECEAEVPMLTAKRMRELLM